MSANNKIIKAKNKFYKNKTKIFFVINLRQNETIFPPFNKIEKKNIQSKS